MVGALSYQVPIGTAKRRSRPQSGWLGGGEIHSENGTVRALSESDVSGVKLYTQNVFEHGGFCWDPSCLEDASIAKLLPHAVPGLALPLNGR